LLLWAIYNCDPNTSGLSPKISCNCCRVSPAKLLLQLHTHRGVLQAAQARKRVFPLPMCPEASRSPTAAAGGCLGGGFSSVPARFPGPDAARLSPGDRSRAAPGAPLPPPPLGKAPRSASRRLRSILPPLPSAEEPEGGRATNMSSLEEKTIQNKNPKQINKQKPRRFLSRSGGISPKIRLGEGNRSRPRNPHGVNRSASHPRDPWEAASGRGLL